MQAARDRLGVTFDVHDVSTPLPFTDASLGGVLAAHVVQHLGEPAALLAEIRRCLRPGAYSLITAPTRDGAPLASRSPYWRIRAAFYERVPGVVCFFDTNSLPRLVEDEGMTVVKFQHEGRRVTVLARTQPLVTPVQLRADRPPLTRTFVGAERDQLGLHP